MTAFRVTVDISSVKRASARAGNLFRRMQGRLLAIADRHAQKLVAGDRYQNRTGSLRHGGRNGPGTQALADSGAGKAGPEVSVTLEMDTPYASFVVSRGFSDFDAEAKAADAELAAECNAIADEVASG